jgi:hypothetical protein
MNGFLKSWGENLLKAPGEKADFLSKNGFQSLMERNVEEHSRIPLMPMRVLGDSWIRC